MSNRHKIAPAATGRRPKRTGNDHWDRRQPIPEPKAYGGHGPAPSVMRLCFSAPAYLRHGW